MSIFVSKLLNHYIFPMLTKYKITFSEAASHLRSSHIFEDFVMLKLKISKKFQDFCTKSLFNFLHQATNWFHIYYSKYIDNNQNIQIYNQKFSRRMGIWFKSNPTFELKRGSRYNKGFFWNAYAHFFILLYNFITLFHTFFWTDIHHIIRHLKHMN